MYIVLKCILLITTPKEKPGELDATASGIQVTRLSSTVTSPEVNLPVEDIKYNQNGTREMWTSRAQTGPSPRPRWLSQSERILHTAQDCHTEEIQRLARSHLHQCDP